MDRIVPANLHGDELWRRNGEYVDADSYDAAVHAIDEIFCVLASVQDELPPAAWEQIKKISAPYMVPKS